MSDATDVEEHRIELSQFDLDHLNAGQPVFKGIGEDVLLVLYSDAPLEDGGSDE
ncbi:hypothetical protein M197_gp77 [Haloarcula hispanica tailed virus 2]|uniref:Uncharacterized protein n=1 Tax=Haloarcula hispanica tailed virus 2 TaxID=1273751 RepID=R4TG84_9CAUD|nr:hypothetical protein M197_gp77 [Haloarcula hispanica tailed virus 2]AGM11241.1 hypothetical protein HHTV2_77 [Haloarcula hispanica tailed virus 2]